MRIVINTTQLLSARMGVGNYTYQVATRAPAIDTANTYRYFCRTFSKSLPGLETKEGVRSFKEGIKRVPALSRAARGCLDLLARMPHRGFDLYFEPGFIPLPVIKARRTIATIHDFSFHLYPGHLPEERAENFRKNFWTNIKRADAIITVSNFVKDEALGLLDAGGRRIKVIHHGVDKSVFRPYERPRLDGLKRLKGLPGNFILFVGAVEPRKNIVRLVEAYRSLRPGVRKEVKLVMAGGKGWRGEDIRASMDSLGDDLVYLGYVPDEELAALYNMAELLIYPSIYEGFGFPPVEAMACGCPAVVSNSSSLPEVCGDAALYVDPGSVDSIAEGLSRMVGDTGLREEMRRKGLVRAERFSWESSVAEHVRLFHEVMGI